MTKWRKISTAPKDGTRILLFDPRFDDEAYSGSGHKGAWFTDHECEIDPIGWMPLPEGPGDG